MTTNKKEQQQQHSPSAGVKTTVRWEDVEAEIRRRDIHPMSVPKSVRKRKPMKIAACAAMAAAFCGMLAYSALTSGWLSGERSIPTVELSGEQSDNNWQDDKIIVSDVCIRQPLNRNEEIEIGYTNLLNLDETIQYLDYDMLVVDLPNDLNFNRKEFENGQPKLEYDADGKLIALPNYNEFYFAYTGDTNIPRRLTLYCSKVCTQVGKLIYQPIDNSEFTPSEINGNAVKIGHISTEDIFDGFNVKMPTERYVAEFTVAGIHTQVTADNLTLDEFIAVIKSIIR